MAGFRKAAKQNHGSPLAGAWISTLSLPLKSHALQRLEEPVVGSLQPWPLSNVDAVQACRNGFAFILEDGQVMGRLR